MSWFPAFCLGEDGLPSVHVDEPGPHLETVHMVRAPHHVLAIAWYVTRDTELEPVREARTRLQPHVLWDTYAEETGPMRGYMIRVSVPPELSMGVRASRLRNQVLDVLSVVMMCAPPIDKVVSVHMGAAEGFAHKVRYIMNAMKAHGSLVPATHPVASRWGRLRCAAAANAARDPEYKWTKELSRRARPHCALGKPARKASEAEEQVEIGCGGVHVCPNPWCTHWSCDAGVLASHVERCKFGCHDLKLPVLPALLPAVSEGKVEYDPVAFSRAKAIATKRLVRADVSKRPPFACELRDDERSEDRHIPSAGVCVVQTLDGRVVHSEDPGIWTRAVGLPGDVADRLVAHCAYAKEHHAQRRARFLTTEDSHLDCHTPLDGVWAYWVSPDSLSL